MNKWMVLGGIVLVTAALSSLIPSVDIFIAWLGGAAFSHFAEKSDAHNQR